jgi:hypothetical protein
MIHSDAAVSGRAAFGEEEEHHHGFQWRREGGRRERRHRDGQHTQGSFIIVVHYAGKSALRLFRNILRSQPGRF